MRGPSEKVDPITKDILLLLQAGKFITAKIIIPNLPDKIKPFLGMNQDNEWNNYNTWRLRQVLKRMHKQKLVEINETSEGFVVNISEKGKKRLLKYNLETMHLQNKKWDGKWRIIIYDIYSKKKNERKMFYKMLKQLKFLKLQRSVYLTPYQCQDEIEYLRQICNIDSEVLMLTASGLENETAYKEYFGIAF